MKNILITGATSFIGKHLIKRLVNQGECNITALVRDGSNLGILAESIDNIALHYYCSDYDSIDSLFQEKSFDCVIHLAAFSSADHRAEDISKIIDSNIKLGTFILEALKKYNCKYFINTSTYWQHYKNNDQPICLYAATKEAFEDIIKYYCIDGEIKAISLKLHDVYGYDDHRGKLLNTLIKNRNSDKILNLTKGEQKLHMVFIDDVIDAYIEVLALIKDNLNNDENHAIYGIYGKEKFSLREIVETLEEIMGKKLNINWGKKGYYKFQIMEPRIENKLAHWEAKVSLREGIKIILNKENYGR
jgi:CDP-paratose synthetase